MSRYLGKKKLAIKQQILSSIYGLPYEGKINFLEAFILIADDSLNGWLKMDEEKVLTLEAAKELLEEIKNE